VSTAGVSRRAAEAARQGVSTFLGIVGVVAIVVGVLYLVAARNLPHVLQGAVHSQHHPHRAGACLAAGAVCLVVSWLIRVRHRT
jgi:hypothetical protein